MMACQVLFDRGRAMLTTSFRADVSLVGHGRLVRTSRLGEVPLVDADHAATTRPLRAVWERLEGIMADYGSVFRGSGPNSVTSSVLFEEALRRILDFVGVRGEDFFVLVGRNATDVLNRLARRLELAADDELIVSNGEHSSNDLPWRRTPALRTPLPVDMNGLIDLDALAAALRKPNSRGRRFVVLTGASNITGAYQPYRAIARAAHAAGAFVVVDASQLAAHRPIVDKSDAAAEVPDVVAFSGHKMYAPFGAGFLIVRRGLFASLGADDIGGGTVDLVTAETWVPSRRLERRELAGTPNYLGVVGTALAGEYLRHVLTFPAIERHEGELLDTIRNGLTRVPNLVLHAPISWDPGKNAAVVTFSVKDWTPVGLGRVLAESYGIGIRAGHLCQFQLVQRWLSAAGLLDTGDEVRLRAGEDAPQFGVARASFGIDSTAEDCMRLCRAIAEIASGAISRPTHISEHRDRGNRSRIWFDEGMETT